MRFYVLGPLEVATNTGALQIRARRLRALLAILLLNAGDVVSIDRIVDGIWPEQPPRSVLENIRTYVWQLRSLLYRAWDRGRLESHPGGYRLLTDAEELDMLRFTALAGDGKRALQARDYSSAAVLLGEAIELWRGAPVAELDLGPAIRAKTVALEEQRWAVQSDWINARMALGEHKELVATLRELIGERPLDEDLWRCLGAALYALGRTGEALATFAEARQTIVSELGIEPGPELRRMQAAVLKGEELVSAQRFSPIPSLQSSRPHHQLPVPGSGFVGRRDERLRVHDLVEQSNAGPKGLKVVLVSGPPGVGKTATAVVAANDVREAYPDGQLYLDLRGSTGKPLDLASAVTSLLGDVGVTIDSMSGSADHCLSLYRMLLGSRRMLVLLDDADSAEQILPLFPGTGRSLVIVTSRRWLAGMEADEHLRLEPLACNEALGMLAGIVGPQRVAEEPAAALTIVRACGGLPAAIHIAGARLAARPKHPLSVIAERLRAPDNLMDELTLNGRSMRALLDASYRGLDEEMQQSFRALSMMDRDHITAAGLGDLIRLAVDAADRRLEGLVHEALLSPGTMHEGVPIYWMPTVLHAYARERLAVDGMPVWRAEDAVAAVYRG
jgi:DNA-binding SARP family transcriptional activator/DNA polymerase III delta prime subunit